jgi:hypothetical protein
MMPTAPLRLRNRLAEIILQALSDPAARGELERLDGASWLADARPEHVALVRARAQRAREALAACPLLPAAPGLADALVAAAALFDAELYFEVHELLEPHWTRATGAERQALQGLIQVAVGFQHLANGNLEGARSLLVEGGARLRDGRLPGLDLASFADAVAVAATRLASDAVAPKLPRHRRPEPAPPSPSR